MKTINESMRDAFLDKLYDLARYDKNLMLLSSDMGAVTLDKYRSDFPRQFLNVGIAEENMMAIASGLALEGKNVYTFAIAPFITARCYEFIKIDLCSMDLPIKIVGVGTGFGYDDAGPTHHSIDDIAIMRVLPNLEILSPADSSITRLMTEYSHTAQHPLYLRLDRKVLPEIESPFDMDSGFRIIKESGWAYIIAIGNMVSKALEYSKKAESNGMGDVGVIDLFRLKPVNKKIDGVIAQKNLVTIEEHLLEGGLGSIISERITDRNLESRLKRLGLKDFVRGFGGRENMLEVNGISESNVMSALVSHFIKMNELEWK